MTISRASKPKKSEIAATSTRDDAKKKAKAYVESTPKKERFNIKEYFRGVKTEMKKVVWPTKKELGAYTVIVVIACAFFSLAFWGIDTGFLAALKGLLGITM